MSRLKPARGIVLLALLLAGGLFLARWTGPGRSWTSPPESWWRDLLAPLQSGATVVVDSLRGIGEGLAEWRGLAEENEALRREVERLRQENTALQEARQENARLKKLLRFADLHGQNLSFLPARVIGRDAENWFSTLTLNVGYADGVQKDMPVVNDRGLVGRVTAVSARSAQVLTVLDRDGAVAALVQQTRVAGVVEGVGDGSGRLQMIHLAHDAPVLPEQTVISSGLGLLYPKGLRIGYVEEIVPEANGLMKKALVRPFVDFNRLEEVLVVTGWSGGE